MALLKIKEFAEKSGVSQRTLRHYDQLGLLSPSYRADNGYRYYNKDDFSRLQQINILKTFGFSLKEIQQFIDNHENISSSLKSQSFLLKLKSQTYSRIASLMDNIIENQESIKWEEFYKLALFLKTDLETWEDLKHLQLSNDLTDEFRIEFLEFKKYQSDISNQQERAFFLGLWSKIEDKVKVLIEEERSQGKLQDQQIELIIVDYLKFLNKTYYGSRDFLLTRNFHQQITEKYSFLRNHSIIEWIEKKEQQLWIEKIEKLYKNRQHENQLQQRSEFLGFLSHVGITIPLFKQIYLINLESYYSDTIKLAYLKKLLNLGTLD